MKESTKSIINQINSGFVPNGYRKTKVGIVPAEWGTVKLKTISKHCNEKNTDLKYHETYTNSATQGIIKQTDYFEKQISNNENIDVYYVVKQNDYVYNPRISVSAPCGPISKSHFSETGIMSPLYTVFRLNDEYENNGYIEHYFKSSFWHRYMSSVANYGARHDRMNITNNDFFEMPIPFPPLPEQQKIAEILSTQDKLIELKQKLIDLKKHQKKWLMQELLTGKKRLKGFSGEWERVKLRDICKISAGGDIDKEHCKPYNDEKFQYPVYANAFTNKGLYGYSDIYKVSGETVTVTGRGEIGFAIARNEKYYPVVRLLVLEPKKKLNIIFLEHQINIGKIYMESTGVPQLTAPQLALLKVYCPSLKEQTAIAEILSQQDKEIELLEKELELQKQKKKALMQLLLTGKVRVKP